MWATGIGSNLPSLELAFFRCLASAHLRVRLTSLASLEGKSVTSVCVLLVSISRVEFLFLMEPTDSNLASGMHPVHPFLKPFCFLVFPLNHIQLFNLLHMAFKDTLERSPKLEVTHQATLLNEIASMK
jgi:hypothetical protein